MTKTKYYDLQMDDPQDDYDVEVVNANLKKIDEQMKTRENATDALQEPEFTVAAKRENIASKEKMPKILGKIAKFFADLKTVAFSGKYNDLDGKPAIVNNNTTTEPGSALDARQANPNIEGTMAASIAQINSNLLKFQRFTVTTTEIAVNSDSYIKLLYPQSYKELIALIPMFIRPRSHWNSRGTFWNFDGSQINFHIIGLESASAQTFDIEYYWVYK